MAFVPFPAAAVPTSMTLQLLYVGDITHRSIYTGAQQTLARAPGRWTGSMELAPTDADADRREIEAWLAAMRGTANFSFLPLAGRGIADRQIAADRWALRVGIDGHAAIGAAGARDPRGLNDDGSVWLALAAGADLPSRGDYVTVEERLYCVLEARSAIPWILAATGLQQPGMRCTPGAYPATGPSAATIVRNRPFARAQILDEPALMPLDGEYGGPWSFRWIEAT